MNKHDNRSTYKYSIQHDLGSFFSREFLGFVLQSSMAEKITYGPRPTTILNERASTICLSRSSGFGFPAELPLVHHGVHEHVLGETGLDAGVDRAGFFTAWITLPRASQLKR